MLRGPETGTASNRCSRKYSMLAFAGAGPPEFRAVTLPLFFMQTSATTSLFRTVGIIGSQNQPVDAEEILHASQCGRRMIRCVDIESSERIQRIFFESILMPNLIGASRVDIDGPLREEGQYAANIGNHKINFGKALQHPA